ncbi:MAG TPA: GTPase HflX [Polyangiaceae bacterium]|nr:GTPase HflX [Polyangiaceae bacterium]
MTQIHGNTAGLAASALKALERVYRRRVSLDRIATPELIRSLAEASRETGRQVGALVHRSGNIDSVIVGHATGLMLPDIGRLRAAEGRFRALRLVHTHLHNEPLTRDDLVDLTRLRLDLVAAILLDQAGEPLRFTWAYNVPAADGRDAPYEVVGPVPHGSPQPDFGALIGSLEAEFARQFRHRTRKAKDGLAMLVHVGEKQNRGALALAKARLDELAALAETAGVAVADRVIQLRERLDPNFLLGSGKLADVVMRAIELDVETLIFDCNLSPAQAHGIASRTDLKVLDRTQLILDIFAQRAESRDGKLQVELAQLKYTLPRLGQKDDALSRLTGGIGGRGPGETKLELGRRRARERIQRLERELRQIGKQRGVRQHKRSESGLFRVAIVGYTNAGKSTLLNALTRAGVLAEDKLFATLDPRSRRLVLADGGTAILSDTVGLIRNMPEALFAAFRATFEEAAGAELLLEVIDAANPERDEHLQTTESVLAELGLVDRPRLRVYNKIDRLEPAEREALAERADGILVSAVDASTLDALRERLSDELSRVRAKRQQEQDAWAEAEASY